MFNFLPLINSSVTIEFSFLLLSISVIWSKMINISHFLFDLYLSILLQISSLSFEYLTALESLECFKPVLSRLINKRKKLLAKCSVCDSKKSKLIKQQEASGLLSSSGIKSPLSKIPLVCSLHLELLRS